MRQRPPAQRADVACLRLPGGDAVAMLHRPAPRAARGTAVLICPPFGWREACSYRGLRAWARALAADGYEAARLTLPGTGDSGGEAGDPGLARAWLDAVAGAAGWLREISGAERLVAAGIGLGGMLACAAWRDGAPIDDLILWAVPARGRSLLRELRAEHRMIAAATGDDDRARVESDPVRPEHLTGYSLSAETAAALAELDLAATSRCSTAPSVAPASRVLLLGRDGRAPDRALEQWLREHGAQVAVDDGRGYGALIDEPHRAAPPRAVIALTLGWLSRGPQSVPGARGESRDRDPRAHVRHDGVELCETPLWLDGPRGRLFALVSKPIDRPLQPLTLVLLGAGALPHAGPNRGWVRLARRWAARGVATARIDLADVGESDGEDRPEGGDAGFYHPSRDLEVKAVLDGLQRCEGHGAFVLGGLCSGAYVALRRALVDDRVRGLLLVNLAAFVWTRELVAERGRRRALAVALRGSDAGALNGELLRRGLVHARPDRAWRLLRRSAERAQRREVTEALDTLRERDVDTLLLLGRSEGLLRQLERQGFTRRLQRWPNLTLDMLPSEDHLLRAAGHQRRAGAALDEALSRMVVRARGAAIAGSG